MSQQPPDNYPATWPGNPIIAVTSFGDKDQNQNQRVVWGGNPEYSFQIATSVAITVRNVLS